MTSRLHGRTFGCNAKGRLAGAIRLGDPTVSRPVEPTYPCALDEQMGRAWVHVQWMLAPRGGRLGREGALRLDPSAAGRVEGEPRRVQEGPGEPGRRLRGAPVLGVARNRVPEVGEVGADLVHHARHDPHPEEREP